MSENFLALNGIRSLLPGDRKLCKRTQKGPENIFQLFLGFSGAVWIESQFFGILNFVWLYGKMFPLKSTNITMQNFFCILQNFFLKLAGKLRWDLATVYQIVDAVVSCALNTQLLVLKRKGTRPKGTRPNFCLPIFLVQCSTVGYFETLDQKNNYFNFFIFVCVTPQN